MFLMHWKVPRTTDKLEGICTLPIGTVFHYTTFMLTHASELLTKHVRIKF